MFIIPLHRANGHFKLLTQWQNDCFVFFIIIQLCTYLEDFKKHGRNANPYLVVTLFTELLFNKGIVLARSDIINSSMTKSEAMLVW